MSSPSPWLLLLVGLLVGCGAQQQTPPSPETPPSTEERAAPAATPGPRAGAADPAAPPDLSRPLSDCPVSTTPLNDGAPLRLNAEQSLQRWGRDIAELDQVASSLQVPVEVCGVAGQMRWLLNVTCPDGSTPFSSADEAHRARVGNAGRGGRCGTIVDIYRIECPGVTREVYLDLYHCGPSEEFPQG